MARRVGSWARLGLNLLEFLTLTDSLSFYRRLVAEAVRAPELGRIFYAQGPAHVHRELARYLRRAARGGELRCSEPELPAKLFLGAVIANYQILGLIARLRAFQGEENGRSCRRSR